MIQYVQTFISLYMMYENVHLLHVVKIWYLTKSFLSLVCWAHRSLLKNSWIAAPLQILSNYNKICVCWLAVVAQNVQNAPDCNQSCETLHCTYIYNSQCRKVQRSKVSNMVSTKCTQFYYQYNIGSWALLKLRKRNELNL